MTDLAQADYLEIGGGEQLAYRRLKGSGTGVTFLCGHGSDMDGTKALEVEAEVAAKGEEATAVVMA